MATSAQITANRLNAQLSTGPKTRAGKAAVAQNHLSHGLSSRNFALLPIEDPAAFESLLSALEDEHQPATPTETFLVTEMARAQWKLERVQRIEAEILSPATENPAGWSAIAACFQSDCSGQQALLKLNRYEQSVRRAWHTSLTQLLKLRAAAEISADRESRIRKNEMESMIHEVMNAPIPGDILRPPVSSPAPKMQLCDSKPMPDHLERELAAHTRRDPLFDPRMDASQMSKELQKWFARNSGELGN